MVLFFTSSNYPKCKLICTSGNLDLQKSLQRQMMVGESNKNCIVDPDRRFEFRRIRDIRVRDIEIRLYIHNWHRSDGDKGHAFILCFRSCIDVVTPLTEGQAVCLFFVTSLLTYPRWMESHVSSITSLFMEGDLGFLSDRNVSIRFVNYMYVHGSYSKDIILLLTVYVTSSAKRHLFVEQTHVVSF